MQRLGVEGDGTETLSPWRAVPPPGCQSWSGSAVTPSLPATSLFRLLPGGSHLPSCSGNIATRLDSLGEGGGRREGTCRHKLTHLCGCESLGVFPTHAPCTLHVVLARHPLTCPPPRPSPVTVAGTWRVTLTLALNAPPEVTQRHFCSRSLGRIRPRGDGEVQFHDVLGREEPEYGQTRAMAAPGPRRTEKGKEGAAYSVTTSAKLFPMRLANSFSQKRNSQNAS